MKNLIKIIILISVGLFLNSCYYDSFPEYIEVEPPEVPDDISYKDQIMPLWEGQCVACHNGNVAPDLRPENSYNALLNGFVEAGKSEESILYLSLIHAPNVVPMPDPNNKWSVDKTSLVKGWIDQGAKNN